MFRIWCFTGFTALITISPLRGESNEGAGFPGHLLPVGVELSGPTDMREARFQQFRKIPAGDRLPDIRLFFVDSWGVGRTISVYKSPGFGVIEMTSDVTGELLTKSSVLPDGLFGDLEHIFNVALRSVRYPVDGSSLELIHYFRPVGLSPLYVSSFYGSMEGVVYGGGKIVDDRYGVKTIVEIEALIAERFKSPGKMDVGIVGEISVIVKKWRSKYGVLHAKKSE